MKKLTSQRNGKPSESLGRKAKGALVPKAECQPAVECDGTLLQEEDDPVEANGSSFLR